MAAALSGRSVATAVVVEAGSKRGTISFPGSSPLHGSSVHDDAVLEGGVIEAAGMLLSTERPPRPIQANRRLAQRFDAQARHRAVQGLL